jgi:hypothetical protein
MQTRWGLRRAVGLVFLVCAVSSCAQFVRPVDHGESLIEKSGVGLVFGRIAVIRDGQDQMSAMPNVSREFGWTLMRAESGKRYVADPLTDNGIFALYLPAGIYHVTKLVYEDREGIWEGSLASTFIVKPTGLTYIGTWEITVAGLGAGVPITSRAVNDLERDREEFEANYKVTAGSIAVAVMKTGAKGRLSLLRPKAEQ